MKRFPSSLPLLLASAVALGVPAGAAAYDWPIKPFDQQHAIRGNFGDPRTPRGMVAGPEDMLSFHAGVDIQAPDGTPVYAIEAGTAMITGPTTVVVGSPGLWASAPLVFGYWHVDPAIPGSTYVARHQLIGYVHRGAGHVHVSERRFGGYVNPLRRGGLAPYVDNEPPVIRRVILLRSGTTRELQPDAVNGMIDIVVDAYDSPPIAPQPPWDGAVMSPARIRWGGLLDGPWFPYSYRPQGVDFATLPHVALADVYAPGTWQNAPNAPGDYRFWLIRGLDTRMLEGDRAIWVTASDIRGNSTTTTFRFTVVSGAPASAGTSLVR